MESLRVRLGKLRQKLLEVIDERLAEDDVDAVSLVDALCAYSLATSSSCADVFRHFHHVRADALSNRVEQAGTPGATVQASLRIWIRTLRETRSLFPRQISSALAKLKEQPLLQDDDVRSSPELDLDIHGVWIEDEAKNFVPYVRSDDLQVAPAAQQLSAWAASALERLLKGIDASLDSLNDPQDVVGLRHETIQLWLSNSNNLQGVNKRQVLERLRNSFQEKLSDLIRQRCNCISEVSSYISFTADDTIRLEEEERSLPGLWNASVVSMNLTSGAEPFVDALDASYHGRTPALGSCSQRYEKWVRSIEEIRSILARMAEARWEDEDDFNDSLSDSDEDPSNTLHASLSVRDPLALGKVLDESLKSALTSFATVFSAPSGPPSPINAVKAAYLLRALRDVTAMLPSPVTSLSKVHSHHPRSNIQPSVPADQFSDLFLPLALALHSAISTQLIEALLVRHQSLIGRLAAGDRMLPGRDLWGHGDPPLPTLPSPTAFRLLRQLYKALESAGPYLWTKQGLEVLRETFRAKLAASLRVKAGAHETSHKGLEGEGHIDTKNAKRAKEGQKTIEQERVSGAQTEPETEVTQSRDARIQRLYDLSLISAATSDTPNTASGKDETERNDALHALREEWAQGLGSLETSAVTPRIYQNANAYWVRSRLLFGLLGAMTAPAGQPGG